MYIYISLLSSILSLSSIHILRIESLIRIHLKSFGSSPFRTPARASNGRSRACACFVFNSSTLRFDLNAMASFSSWQRDSILRPSERTSYVLPQDHGALALLKKVYIMTYKLKISKTKTPRNDIIAGNGREGFIIAILIQVINVTKAPWSWGLVGIFQLEGWGIKSRSTMFFFIHWKVENSLSREKVRKNIMMA